VSTADFIVFLADGAITEQGSHVRAGSAYAELHTLQAHAYQ